jgi:transglutaminase-like putative cysteine protease
MLFYLLPEIFLLLWILLRWQMWAGGGEAFRMAARIFVLSLPLVVLLFLFFPRISFGESRFGFRGDRIARTGHDGTMYLDNRALLIPSDRIVMEMEFAGGVPPGPLYLRGSVLYRNLGERWEGLSPGTPRAFAPARHLPAGACRDLGMWKRYRVKLYPTERRWLYFPEIPLEIPRDARIDADFVVKREKPVERVLRYRGRSALKHRCGLGTTAAVREAALQTREGANPRSRTAAEAIRRRFSDPARRIEAIERLFRDQNLTYTLRPARLEVANLADALLFGTREGYCVHFAAAFTTLARLAGVPARIVTGYMATAEGRVENYLAVRERDAHAWSEVWLGGAWKRVDPTAWARYIRETGTGRAARAETRHEAGDAGPGSARWRRWELYGLYLRYRVEEWILRYDYLRRLKLIESLKGDSRFALGFAGGILLLLALSLGLYLYWKRPGCGEARAYCGLQPLLRQLERRGCGRKSGDVLGAYLERCARELPGCEAVETLGRLYQGLRYGRKK